VKVGDLVKIDFKGWKLSVEFLEVLREEFCGVVIAKFTKQYDKNEHITIITTDGKHKTFPCNPQLPPNITVVSAGDH
jgi:hypothetical protein